MHTAFFLDRKEQFATDAAAQSWVDAQARRRLSCTGPEAIAAGYADVFNF